MYLTPLFVSLSDIHARVDQIKGVITHFAPLFVLPCGLVLPKTCLDCLAK